MKEYIERDAVLQDFKEVKPVNWDNTEYEKQAVTDYNFYRSIVENAPTTDVAPVIHGEWKPFMEWFEDEGVEKQTCWVCSICGRVEVQKEPYCNCGARMDRGNK